MPSPQLPFLDFLTGGVALDNALAVCDDTGDGWLRYGGVRERVKTIRSLLGGRDFLSPSDRNLVLCCLPRTINGVCAYLGAASSGHALLMIDPGTIRPDQFIAHYSPEWVILPSAFHPGPAYSSVDWNLPDLFLWHRAPEPLPVLHPDLFLLLLPPGPPESVKTVRLTYKNLASNTLANVEILGITAETRAILHMPLSYSFGLSILNMVFTTGASVVVSELDIKNRALWETMQSKDVTLFAGVPFHYEYIARARLENLRIPRIKTFVQAGGRMPFERTQDLLRQINERQAELHLHYGLTEASPRIAWLDLHKYPEKTGSLGKAIPGGILEKEGKSIVYRGPNVMMGYANGRDDLSKGDELQGQLHLGNDGYIDEDGFLFMD